jgi:hypothetical protein
MAIVARSSSLKYVKKQTPELCELAIQLDGYNLEYVKKSIQKPSSLKNYFICCKLAVQQNGLALKFAKADFLFHEYPTICKLAVQQNGWALKFVKQEEISLHDLSAICRLAVQYVNNNTNEKIVVEEIPVEDYNIICKLAILQNSLAAKYIKIQR